MNPFMQKFLIYPIAVLSALILVTLLYAVLGKRYTDKIVATNIIGSLCINIIVLLAYFMENKGIALSRETILAGVWNYNYFGDARTVDTHVKKLRSKMGEKGNLIKTVWGLGYKFEA